jgi:hypothetical protein
VPRSLPADEADQEDVEDFLARRKRFKHLRVRRRADLLTLESGPADDPVRHARLRRVAGQHWAVECATHTGRWEKTGFRGPLLEMVQVLTSIIPWVLTPIE